MVKNPPANAEETWVPPLGWEDPLEEGIATHFSILVRRIPWTEEPGIAWKFLKKLEIELPYNPAIPLLDIHTEETRIERDMCTTIFITALFVIARTWKQPRCPSTNEWIRKLW